MTPRAVCLDLRGDRIRPLRTNAPRAVLCLGNFDGVHIAHASLIRQGRRMADEIKTGMEQEAVSVEINGALYLI